MTTGSSGGFLLAFLSAFDPGAKVAMARPGYPAYRNLLSVLGCEVVEFATTAETNFQPTVGLLDELGPIDGLIVASPSNPTGTVLPPGELAAITGWCSSHGVQLISDEIYHGISYGAELDCAWQYGREPIVLGSFSKYFAMTGWRLGWMLVPQRLHRAVDVLTGNFTICPPAVSQYAALAAFTPGGVRGGRRARRALPRQPRPALRRPEAHRPRQARPRRRRLLRVRRRQRVHRGQPELVPAAARRHGPRHHARRRLRPGRRRQVRPVLLRRQRRRTSTKASAGSVGGSARGNPDSSLNVALPRGVSPPELTQWSHRAGEATGTLRRKPCSGRSSAA